ncbi:MAG TPA: SRPBCC family protein [Candidatus Acidoferrales bacterium]|nr:SRPBCC family protein [Candidatus Acidoferrales bacterium]
MSEAVFKPKTVYVTYIVTTPEKLWAALTDAAFTKQYFFGRRVESDWSAGSAVTYRMEDGRPDVYGKVLQCQPPRLLSFTWNVEWREDHATHLGKSLDELRRLPECSVTFQLDDLGEVVRLTMTESHQLDPDESLLEGGRRGWPVILSGLKSLLETGHALPPFSMNK